MRLLDDRPLLTKLASPLAVLVFVTIGMISLAITRLDRVAELTRWVIDVPANRQADLLGIQAAVNAAALADKSGLADRRIEYVQTQYGFFTDARKRALELAARQQSDNGVLRNAVTAYIAEAEASMQAQLAGKFEESEQISNGKGRELRRALARMIQERVDDSHAQMRDAKATTATLAGDTRTTLVSSSAAALLVSGALLGWIVLTKVVRPLARITHATARLAAGDLDLSIGDTQRKDEIGTLARALDVFKDNAVEARRLGELQARETQAKLERSAHLERLMHGFEDRIAVLTNGLAHASSELEATAAAMAATAEETNRQAVEVAASANQTSANVQTVAAATDELAASVNEIDRHVRESARIANAAAEEAARTDATVQELAGSADQIGEVVSMIGRIAAQTNLLALNATIEAARAGDAGRGFAVVASEVKALAQQTADATAQVDGLVARIRGATSNSVGALRTVGSTIDQMTGIAQSVATAIEEQGAATREIARNVQHAAQGTEAVTSTIEGVRGAANDTGTAAEQVRVAAAGVARDSAGLKSEIERFLLDVRAA